MTRSAVLFIVFNRPDTSEQVLSRIIEAKPKHIYVAGDGARNEAEKKLVNQTREVVENLTKDFPSTYLWREKNLGCKRGVIGAIDWFFENEDAGIILEDDCFPDPSFFSFCDHALNTFKEDKKVMQVAGSNLMIKGGNSADDAYFSRLPNIWGWATWKRAWNLYDPNMSQFDKFINDSRLKEIIKDDKLRKRYIKLFRKIYAGVDTWDFQWTYSTIMNEGLNIIPNKNLITNIGFGNNATHSIDPENPLANLPLEQFESTPKLDNLVLDEESERKFLEVTNKLPPFHLRVINKLKKVKNILLAQR